jgi:hypothetical protein
VNARERARTLVARGRIDEARAALLELVARDPNDPGALADLGTVLVQGGFREAARTAYERALQLAPDDAVHHANLANVLFALGDYPAARERYEAALALDPELAQAHQGLSYAFVRLGEDAAAARHRQLGFAGRALIAGPYHGPGPAVDVLLAVAAAGGTLYTDEFFDPRQFRVTTLVVDAYAGEPLPPHQVVFNAISDADRCAPELARVGEFAARGSAAIINDPARVLATTRRGNAKRLGELPGVVTAATVRLQRADLSIARLAAEGIAPPLLLRAPGFHTGQHFVRVDRDDGLLAAAAALPGDEVLALAFLDTRAADGTYRKYRVMFVDGDLYPLHLAVASDWKVHYFTAGMAGNAAHRAEDARFLDDPAGVLGPVAVAALERVRDALGLDYAGVDFAIDRAGRVVVFEANATMIVLPPGPEAIWDYRRPHVTRVVDAVRRMVRRAARAAGG